METSGNPFVCTGITHTLLCLHRSLWEKRLDHHEDFNILCLVACTNSENATTKFPLLEDKETQSLPHHFLIISSGAWDMSVLGSHTMLVMEEEKIENSITEFMAGYV